MQDFATTDVLPWAPGMSKDHGWDLDKAAGVHRKLRMIEEQIGHDEVGFQKYDNHVDENIRYIYIYTYIVN